MPPAWISLSHVIVENARTGGFNTLVANRYHGGEQIEVRRMVPLTDDLRKPDLYPDHAVVPRPSLLGRIREMWRDYQEWRAVRKGEPVNWYGRMRAIAPKKQDS